MSDFKVNWQQVHSELNSMGGWANDLTARNTRPDAECGLEPIANRPNCWDWRPETPPGLRGKPEPEPADRPDAFRDYDTF